MLTEFHEIGLFTGAIGAILGVTEIGFRLGRRRRIANVEQQKEHIESLQSSMLVLLALLLAFTFSMALSRFDTRKQLVLQEANAIGTTLLRTHLMQEPQGEEMRKLLRGLIETRLKFYYAGTDLALIEAANAEAAELTEKLWKLAIPLAAQDPRSVTVGLLIQSLNEVIDLQEKRLVAFENHVPEVVLHLLFVVTIASFGFISFSLGLIAQRYYVSTMIFAALIAMVMATIIDIDRPRRGLIKVGQESLLRLRAAMEVKK